MKTSVQLGGNTKFDLQTAILIYGSGEGGKFATVHDAKAAAGGGAPYLSEGHALSVDFLRSLAGGLGKNLAPEILPDNVLVRTPEMIVWWSGRARRAMFFDDKPEHKGLSGNVYPHPALVWKLHGHSLSVRALVDGIARPTAKAPMMVAPYFNTNGGGLVCLGSMKVPANTTVENFIQWQVAYFNSQFTHSNAGRLCKYPGGFSEMWKALVNGEFFPEEYLVNAKQTLRQFVMEEGR